jgi:hypothetical protein
MDDFIVNNEMYKSIHHKEWKQFIQHFIINNECFLYISLLTQKLCIAFGTVYSVYTVGVQHRQVQIFFEGNIQQHFSKGRGSLDLIV